MSSDQREQILACARDIYVEEGLQGLSMRSLAERVGVTAPAIYRHFEGKEDLLSEIIGEGLELFGTYIYGALEGESPAERLHLGARAYLDFALEQRRFYEVLFMSPAQLGLAGLPEDTRNQAAATFQFLVDRVRECMDEGVLREDDPCEVATTIWAHGHGLVSLYHSGSMALDEVAFRELFMRSRSRLMAGLAPPGDGSAGDVGAGGTDEDDPHIFTGRTTAA